MPFPMRIQPIDAIGDTVKPPLPKSRLKRLFDRPINTVFRISSAEKNESSDSEPSSVCLYKMVQNFMEDNNERVQSSNNRCGDESGFFSDSLIANDRSDTLKSLVASASVDERNLLSHTCNIIEKKNKSCKGKEDLRKLVSDGLISLGYDASVCRSKWEKSSSIPAGEYEYIDVITQEERMIIDVDFRSEFEIARSTSSYKSILQCLPSIFVGKSDRLLQIVSIVSEAAQQSLNKKGMHIAPWRKPDYIKSKWLSPHTRLREPEAAPQSPPPKMTWQPPPLRPQKDKAVVTGLAFLLKDKV